MNTKTMRLPPRRVLTPSSSTNKRKEREDPFERPKPIITSTTSKLLKPDRPSPRPGTEPIATAPTPSSSKGLELTTPSNQLLAGYLAHEYLTKGTLLGHPWAPARVESPTIAEKKKETSGEDCRGEEGGAAAATPCRKVEEEKERYVKVAELLKGGGVHLSGVVNPTQLARFLHL